MMAALATGLLVLAALAFPLVGGEGYLTHLAITILVFSILAASLNLLMGYSGLVSIAHAAFFGVGGYTSGILSVKAGIPFWLALPAAAVMAGLVALGVGLPSFRTRGVYYIIVTVAFQLIASEIFENWDRMTGGGIGLKGIPRPGPHFVTKVQYYYLTLAVAALAHGAIVRIVRSPIGLALSAIRDSESKARMMGVNPLHYKVLVFVAASTLAGLAGSLYVHYLNFAHPDFFNFGVSVDLFLAVMLGGAGTLSGPIFGVVVLEAIREVLHEFAAVRLLIFGALLIVLILFLPQGVLPPIMRRLRKRPPAGPAAAQRAGGLAVSGPPA
jgi:branched-chain amino acid transport system permease protein